MTIIPPISIIDSAKTVYERNARRIALELEAAIPQLRADTKGKDFRPGGGGEKIVSGVMARMPPTGDMPEEWKSPGLDLDGPIDFEVIYGGTELLDAAADQLERRGIL